MPQRWLVVVTVVLVGVAAGPINMITNALMRAAHDKAEVTEVVPFANNYLTYVTDGFNKAFQTPYPKEDSLKGRMYLFIL